MLLSYFNDWNYLEVGGIHFKIYLLHPKIIQKLMEMRFNEF